MTKLIDVHTHCAGDQTKDIFSLRNIIFAREKKPNSIPCTLGIHPWYLPDDQEQALAQLKRTAADPNILAIGECGLDKYSDHPFELQMSFFMAQVHLANLLNKPLIIHCVKSYQECIELLERSKNRVPVIFHGFSKHKSLAEQLIKKGFYLSLGHQILKGRHDDMLQELPLDQIFFETDDQPLQIGEIYTYFCRVKKMELADLSKQICKNFHRIFKNEAI